MNILLLLKAPHYLRPFATTVRELAERGHRIRIAWFAEARTTREQVTEPFADYPTVTFTTVAGARSVRRHEVAVLRRTWNYLRYLDEPYRVAEKLRKRALSKLWRIIREGNAPLDAALEQTGTTLTVREVQGLKSVLAYVESLIPPDPECEAFLRESQADVLLVSPLVDLNSSTQADFVKAAAHVGVPVGMLVYSWDNLSTKGGLHVMPDRVFVWNKHQRDEAIKLHAVPRERLVITGAPRFDAFLACAPRLDRKTFCGSLGFDPTKPIVTYVCSSAFVSGHELPFVERWLRELRSSQSPILRECNVLVRPHPDVALVSVEMPATKPEWGLDDIAAAVRRPFDDPRAVVLNTTSVTPQGLFECLWHSSAIVGLNTSAEIEAGLVGRPVLSIKAGDAADGQETTLHFHYLLQEQGGFVQVAGSFAEHVDQLHQALSDALSCGKTARKLAFRFVRPHGPDVPVSRVLADAIEREFERGTIVSTLGGRDVEPQRS